MLATAMPPQASHRPPSLSSPTSGAEGPALDSIMSPAIPPQPSSASHPSMSCGLTSNATTSRPSALTRPKLTLQTSSLPITFGSSSTGLSLSLAAGPAASPTVRNTFKNAYDGAYPTSATASPSRSFSNRFPKPSSPYTSSNPYQLPLGMKSILRNSPLESNKRRSNPVAPSGPNGPSTSRRVFFPIKKQVSYRYPLEEEIKTIEYTTRHSDIISDPESTSCEPSSDEDSDLSSSSLPSSETTASDEEAEVDKSNASGPKLEKKKKKRKYRSAERQVRAVALMDNLAEDPYASLTPQTPRQGRLKRRREWRWTLGPLEEGDNDPQSTQSVTASVSDIIHSTSSVSEYEPTKELDTPATNNSNITPSFKPSQPPPSNPVSICDTSEKHTALNPEPADPDPPY